MTFVSVGIVKVEEDNDIVKYAFGNPPNTVLGHVSICKSDGHIELLNIVNDKYKKRVVPYVKKQLMEHFEVGEFPDKTSYMA